MQALHRYSQTTQNCFVASEEDRHQIQTDLDRLVQWSEDWQLGFNEGKCKVLHLGSRNPKNDYHMKGMTLTVTTEEKDLGVIIDDELKFHKHVSAAVKKSSRMLGLIRATFTCLNEITVPRLFTTLVRPHLEYGNIIWSPRFKMDSIEVEKVQRRATRLISNLRQLSYEDRLRTLKLPSLNYRRRRGDMIQVFKIIAGIDRVDPELFFHSTSISQTRGHSQKLTKQRSRLELRSKFFSQRVIDDWNSLPEAAVSSSTLNCFKSSIDRFWRTEQYRIP